MQVGVVGRPMLRTPPCRKKPALNSRAIVPALDVPLQALFRAGRLCIAFSLQSPFGPALNNQKNRNKIKKKYKVSQRRSRRTSPIRTGPKQPPRKRKESKGESASHAPLRTSPIGPALNTMHGKHKKRKKRRAQLKG